MVSILGTFIVVGLILFVAVLAMTPLGQSLGTFLSWLFAANSVQTWWYVTRASGIIAYLLLWFSTILGLAVTSKYLDGMLDRLFTYDFHEFISLLAIAFTLVHVLVLTLDKYLPYTFAQILVPFISPTIASDKKSAGAACNDLGHCTNCHRVCLLLPRVAPHARRAGSGGGTILWDFCFRCYALVACRPSGIWPVSRHLRQRHRPGTLCAPTHLPDRRRWMAFSLCSPWRHRLALGGHLAARWARASRKERLAGDETYVGHPWTRWSQVLPIIFSRTVLFSTLAAFSAYWAIALYLSWNPVYLVTVRHLRLSDPLYLAGITLPYIVGAITLVVFGALADRAFRQTGSQRRSYVYLVTALLFVSALCLFLAVSVPSAFGSIFFSLSPL